MTGLSGGLDRWQPPDDWTRIRTIDAHAAGEPLRIVVDGYPVLPGDTIVARRAYARKHYDHIRKALMWEPRGHSDMYGCVLVPPVSEEADLGVLFLHNEGYSSMCGHGIIALTTVLVETGAVRAIEPETTVRIDTPSGLVTAYARVSGDRVSSVRFHNVASFVVALDQTVVVPEHGEVRYDLAFGGAYYAYVQATDVGVPLTPESHDLLIQKGMQIKRAVAESRVIRHPFEDDLSFLYGTIFIGRPFGSGSDSRNVCIFADGEVDRSPTGTGVSGRMAIHYARGEIALGEPMVIESIIGTSFTGRVIKETSFGLHRAIIPEVEGSACITGRHEFLVNPKDPLRNGFILR